MWRILNRIFLLMNWEKGRQWDRNGRYWRIGKHHGPSIVRMHGNPTSFLTLSSKRYIIQFTRTKQG